MDPERSEEPADDDPTPEIVLGPPRIGSPFEPNRLGLMLGQNRSGFRFGRRKSDDLVTPDDNLVAEAGDATVESETVAMNDEAAAAADGRVGVPPGPDPLSSDRIDWNDWIDELDTADSTAGSPDPHPSHADVDAEPAVADADADAHVDVESADADGEDAEQTGASDEPRLAATADDDAADTQSTDDEVEAVDEVLAMADESSEDADHVIDMSNGVDEAPEDEPDHDGEPDDANQVVPVDQPSRPAGSESTEYRFADPDRAGVSPPAPFGPSLIGVPYLQVLPESPGPDRASSDSVERPADGPAADARPDRSTEDEPDSSIDAEFGRPAALDPEIDSLDSLDSLDSMPATDLGTALSGLEQDGDDIELMLASATAEAAAVDGTDRPDQDAVSQAGSDHPESPNEQVEVADPSDDVDGHVALVGLGDATKDAAGDAADGASPVEAGDDSSMVAGNDASVGQPAEHLEIVGAGPVLVDADRDADRDVGSPSHVVTDIDTDTDHDIESESEAAADVVIDLRLDTALEPHGEQDPGDDPTADEDADIVLEVAAHHPVSTVDRWPEDPEPIESEFEPVADQADESEFEPVADQADESEFEPVADQSEEPEVEPVADEGDEIQVVEDAEPSMPSMEDLRAMAVELDEVDAILERLDADPEGLSAELDSASSPDPEQLDQSLDLASAE